MLIEQDPTWANVLGGVLSAIGGLQQGRQQKYDRQRQQQQDAEQQALQAAQMQEYNAQTTEAQARTRASGYDPNTGQPLAAPKLSDSIQKLIEGNKELTPEQVTGVAMAYMNAGRPDLAKTYLDASTLGYERITQGNLNTARVGLTEEQKKYIAWEIGGPYKSRFDQQMAMLKARGNIELQGRAMSAYRRAGGGGGGNTSAALQREAIAEATALNVANGKEYNEAVRQATDEYNRQSQEYAKTFNKSTGQFSGTAPTYNAPQPPPTYMVMPGTNTVIMAPMGQGGYAAPPGAGGKAPSTGPKPSISQAYMDGHAHGVRGQALYNALISEGYPKSAVDRIFLNPPAATPSQNGSGFGGP